MNIHWANLGIDLHLELDPALGRRAGLERALRDAIRDGRLAPGTRLPATRTLGTELGLARNTVSAAYDQLVAEGFLLARTGSGTVVADVPRPSASAAASTVEDQWIKYDLRPGTPDLATFPAAAWMRATRRALASAPRAAFGYGDPRGLPVLRAALAEYLGRSRGVFTTPAQIIITTGALQALSLVAQSLPGAVAMEEPGLYVQRETVRRAGRRVVAMPVDEHGARLSTVDVSAAVLTAAHQFPSGVTLAPERRHAFVEWARSRPGLLIEDDYDGEFRYDRQPVGALQGMAPDHVIYIGTASKTLAPGLRLAWMVVPPRLVGAIADLKRYSDGQSETIGQLALAEMIRSHAYDHHVRSCRLRYRKRRDLLVARLGRRVRLGGIAAGLHAVIPVADEAAVIDAAGRHGLAVGELGDHWHSPGDRPQGIIVGYGTPPEHQYAAALDILVRLDKWMV